MEIGIIGYKGHSLKLLNITLIFKKVKSIQIFCREKRKADYLNNKNTNKKIKYTNIFSDLLTCKAIIVASDSNSHVSYIKKLIKAEKFIFCEKPACTNIKDYNYLFKLSDIQKSKIYFNYNLKKSKLNIDIKNFLSKARFGKPVHVLIELSQGIAFKSWFNKNWRSSSNNFNNVAGNLGVHYINLLESYFGKVDKITIKINSVSKKNSNDTGIINIDFKNDVSATLILTYAAPYAQRIKFLLTNSILDYQDNSLSVFYPRDCFSKNGLFISPPKIKNIKYAENNLTLSLHVSLIFFLKNVYNNKSFSIEEYDQAILTSKSIINANYC